MFNFEPEIKWITETIWAKPKDNDNDDDDDDDIVDGDKDADDDDEKHFSGRDVSG